MQISPPLPPNTAVIRVRGQSSVRVPADYACLTVTLRAEGVTSARAVSALARATARLTRLLTRYDSTVIDTRVTSRTLAPVPGDSELWAAESVTEIGVGDVAGITGLYTALRRLGPKELSGPRWSLRPEHNAHAAVRRAAVRDAHARAQAMAAAADGGLGELLWLVDNTATDATTVDDDAAGPVAADVALELIPAQLRVQADIAAQYSYAPAPA